MGIKGLIPELRSIMEDIDIKSLRGRSVAIDTYSWLHKGARSCSTKLCKGEPDDRLVRYCMKKVNLLRDNGVKPVLVFDGGLLPMKSQQEDKRKEARKKNLELAIKHESEGKSESADKYYYGAVNISPVIARQLIQVLKRERVQYIVAPYEADAQMAFLANNNHVHAVITEDSDLIPFGCPRIIFKMDDDGGGKLFQYSNLQKNRGLSFQGFDQQMLLEMCILSGCDYLPSLPGMGLKTAHKNIKKFRTYDKVIEELKQLGVNVPPTYKESFRKAVLTFRCQRVYDPLREDIVHLSALPQDSGVELDFLGPPMTQDIAKRIAEGDVDPMTKMPFEEEERGNKRNVLPAQKNCLTKYLKASGMSHTAANQSTQISSSVNSLQHQSLEAATKETINSGASTVGAQNPVSGPPLKSCVSSRKGSPDHKHLRQPIHKPCLGFHKEHELTNIQDKAKEKTTEKKRKGDKSAARGKKKIVPSVQANLVTNYFTPGTAANQSTQVSSSVISLEHQSLEAAAKETMNSGASAVGAQNPVSGPALKSYVDTRTTSMGQPESQ